jgi:hypothetical protein
LSYSRGVGAVLCSKIIPISNVFFSENEKHIVKKVPHFMKKEASMSYSEEP